MSTSVQVLSGPLDDERRGALIFRGDLLVFKRVPALVEVAAVGDGLVPDAPSEAEIDELKERFRRDPRVDRLMRLAVEQVGVAAERTYWDPPRLRIVPPAAGREVGTIGFHRDTWGSNVLARSSTSSLVQPARHDPREWSFVRLPDTVRPLRPLHGGRGLRDGGACRAVPGWVVAPTELALYPTGADSGQAGASVHIVEET